MAFKDFSDKNIRGEFFKRYSEAEAGSWAQRVGMRIGSDQEIETYRWLGMPPQMREWIGGRQEAKLRDEVYTITNKKYEATLAVTNDDVRRDRTGQIMARIADMASKAALHWESLIEAAIVANGLCYDGQNFFDTDHVSGDSGTQTNALTAAEVPSANVTTTTAPTATELSAIIVEMVQHLYKLKDDTGDPINQNARSFLVMVPPSMMANALTALSAQFLTNGVSNPLIANGFSIQLLTNGRSAYTDKIAMFRADGSMKPFILQEEYGVQTEMKDETFDNDRKLFGIRALRNVGYGMWQHAAEVTLS